jgi:transglutaminase-like putative cysteine protease
VSAVAESVVVLTPRERSSSRRAAPAARPWVRLTAFSALGLYGVSRWSTLLSPAPVWRLVGLLALATAAAGVLGAVVQRGRWGLPVAVAGAALVVIAALPIAGVPLQLVVHHHVRSIANGVGEGLGAMPRVLVPYSGIDEWIRVAIVLGAAVLLLDGAFLLAFAPNALGDVRRAVAALPLIALAVVPSTLMRPELPYVHGLVLLALVAALVWGERLTGAEAIAASAITLVAGAGALVLAPAFDTHSPWIDYQSLAGAFSPSRVASFDWSQRYGPLNWPRTGKEMLTVRATRPDYWKAENLDLFDGAKWAQAPIAPGASLPAPDAGAVAAWTQNLRVTIKGMRSTDVIAAGFAAPPQHLATSVIQRESAGTWQTEGDLGPGDAYDVSTYSPRPTHAQLAAAGGSASDIGTGPDWDALADYRSILVPVGAWGSAVDSPHGSAFTVQVAFPSFHSPAPALVNNGASVAFGGGVVMARSPYARGYTLARRLASRASTPIGFVELVERYLSHGFAYNENPPQRPYPLESFLFRDKVGYCQQFAGAMALLLRMGGVPARVAVGFTSGTYDRGARQWAVSDLEAHAWVEAWFPHYGWVRFDPTPSAAPARGGKATTSGAGAAAKAGVITQRRKQDAPRPGTTGVNPGTGSSTPVIPVLAAFAALGLVALSWRARRRPAAGIDRQLAELERAMARSGRPLAPGTTLAQLEQRLRSAPAAAAYVRTLRLTRYGIHVGAPSVEQRRALRSWLAQGLGIGGRLRALWALPPRLEGGTAAGGRGRRRLPAGLN